MINEKGFILPTTLFLCLLIIHIVMLQVHLYQTEKRFIYEQERFLQLEALLQVGIKEFQEGEYEPVLNQTFLFSYETGTVAFTIRSLHDGISSIYVTVSLKSGHKRLAGFKYIWEKSEIINYWEVINPDVSTFPLPINV
ncbi:competence type IV pilus minor pilin ComGG [Halalkalibacter alkalisediminis]|uniref:Competence type IV pilus minor pilin ComGG n=1 Tax=Halalkalibacter alkalisediminis TaxID=935616 RepID=A0ABV6NLK6_9BACI|nr:competence type IV pilus minor pilin ComGG [Halalkalibacter alkalisediminis]